MTTPSSLYADLTCMGLVAAPEKKVLNDSAQNVIRLPNTLFMGKPDMVNQMRAKFGPSFRIDEQRDCVSITLPRGYSYSKSGFGDCAQFTIFDETKTQVQEIRTKTAAYQRYCYF